MEDIEDKDIENEMDTENEAEDDDDNDDEGTTESEGEASAKSGAKRLTKAQIVAELADSTQIDKKAINTILSAIGTLIGRELSATGSGEFVLPGIVKFKTVVKPATKDRQGVNPFTKQPMAIKAKPASRKIRATIIKALKDAVQ